MSKWNQIQNRLLELEGGLFQQVGDAYLRSKRGFIGMNSRGSMIGTDKTISGTPDTVFYLPDGKHVFAQYTTTEASRLKKKLHDDLRECFDFSSTAIPTDEVEEVILCHNSRSDAISHKDKLELRQIAAQHGWRLSIVDVEELAWALWREYPRIAAEFLGITVDTGQVLDIDQFVRQHDKAAMAGPLNTTFHFRQRELQGAVEHLLAYDLLLIVGAAGVGKTRFALECCRQFIAQWNSFHTYCIRNKGVSIYSDIRTYLSPAGDYLVLADDVNRIAERQFILSLLNEDRENCRVKLVVTVRDYAVDSVRDLIREIAGNSPLSLSPFSNDQIRELVRTEFQILNPRCSPGNTLK